MKKNKRVIKCMRYDRVVGYYSSVESWHPGKKHEFEKRRRFKYHDLDIFNKKLEVK